MKECFILKKVGLVGGFPKNNLKLRLQLRKYLLSKKIHAATNSAIILAHSALIFITRKIILENVSFV